MRLSKLFCLIFALSVCAFLFCAAAAGITPTVLAAAVSPAETTATEGTTVYAATVDEFLAAIAPDTEIVLAPGEYNLTKAKSYARSGGDWYHWESTFDGYELVITDLSGLTIRGEDAASVSIVTEPRYSHVIRFDNASCVSVADITMGHTPEKGACAGGVLLFRNCTDLEILRSRLYGCGITGINLTDCADVHVTESDIFECSEGCVAVTQSRNVLFENSKFYNCRLWYGVFDVHGSYNVAFINSEVFGNSGIYPEYGSLITSTSDGIYLGGLDVHDNVFASVFNCMTNPVTVEKCRIQDYGTAAFAAGITPRSPEGKELSKGDIAAMSMRTVSWEPAPEPELPRVEPMEDGRIHVRTVDEFLAAIASNAVIYLEPGIYDLSTAKSYGDRGSDTYRWDQTYDGPELIIRGVSNMTIEGPGADQVTIAARPRYANVLSFENCTNLILRGFMAGHTVEAGSCSGGVIYLNNCRSIEVSQCRLYGCGILGIQAFDSADLTAVGTEICECSSGAAWFYSCANVNLDYCNIHDNGGQEFYADHACRDIYVNGEPIPSGF